MTLRWVPEIRTLLTWEVGGNPKPTPALKLDPFAGHSLCLCLSAYIHKSNFGAPCNEYRRK